MYKEYVRHWWMRHRESPLGEYTQTTVSLESSPETLPADPEEQARDFIKSGCWPDNTLFCPKCRGRKIYVLAEQRYRCPRCKYTFHDFSLRWINNSGLSALQWLEMIDLFADELSANQLSKELSISYNTAYKGLTTIRLAILSQALDSKQFLGRDAVIDLGNTAMGNRRSRNLELPVFGILEKHGLVFIDIIPGLQGESLFHFYLNFHLKMGRLGKLVYTDRYKHYDALIACGDNSLPYEILRNKKDRPAIEQSEEGFWPFAKVRLQKYSGITPQRFPLYVKELEFRYNNRNCDIRPVILDYLCRFVPDLA